VWNILLRETSTKNLYTPFKAKRIQKVEKSSDFPTLAQSEMHTHATCMHVELDFY